MFLVLKEYKYGFFFVFLLALWSESVCVCAWVSTTAAQGLGFSKFNSTLNTLISTCVYPFSFFVFEPKEVGSQRFRSIHYILCHVYLFICSFSRMQLQNCIGQRKVVIVTAIRECWIVKWNKWLIWVHWKFNTEYLSPSLHASCIYRWMKVKIMIVHSLSRLFVALNTVL